MAAQLPYLPPLDRYTNDVKSVATVAAEDVKAQPTVAGKVGATLRAGMGVIPAATVAAVKAANIPAQAVQNTLYPPISQFGRALVGASPTPSIGLPALAAPAPVAAAPATQAPVVIPPQRPADPASATTTSGSYGTVEPSVSSGYTSLPAAPRPAMMRIDHGNGYYTLTNNPVDIGAHQQAVYAEQQRQAVLAAAEQAAATGDPNNATARYNAALGALPHLSGVNGFAADQAQLQAERERTAEAERSNIRTTEAADIANQRTTSVTARDADLRAQELRRNVQATKIGEVVNPDPNTRIYAPKIDVYGTIERDAKGNITVRHTDGTVVQPPAPVPTVGSKVTQKDGTYPLAGGKNAVVKAGVITEIK